MVRFIFLITKIWLFRAGPNAPLAWMEDSILTLVPELNEEKRAQVLTFWQPKYILVSSVL